MDMLIATFDESGDGEIDCQEMMRRLECASPMPCETANPLAAL